MYQPNDATTDPDSVPRRDLSLVGLLVALGLAIHAQRLLPREGHELRALILYCLAVGAFLWGLGGRTEEPERAGPGEPKPVQKAPSEREGQSPWVRAGLVLLCVFFALVAYRQFGGNDLSTGGLLAWGGSIVAYCLAAAGLSPSSAVLRRLRQGTSRMWRRVQCDDLCLWLPRTALLLTAVTLVAIFFRVYRLPGVPAELTSDHAEKLLDVHDVLQGARPIFFPRNTGREAMQFYLTAALIRFTPLSIGHLALKVGTALVSIITVPLVYCLGRAVYGRRVGLLAAGFAAVSRWHVVISRVGLRFPFTPLFTALTLTFLFRAFRHNRRRDWLACGLALGAGLHSYTAVRILPALLVVLTLTKAGFDLVSWLRRRILGCDGALQTPVEWTALSAGFWGNALLGAGASVLVFLPLLRYWRDQPHMFWFRAMTRVSEVERSLPTRPWLVLARNVVDALLMFNYRGDDVPLNSVRGDPTLGPVLGGLFVLGIVVAFWQLLRRGDRRAVYLLVALVVMVLPSAMSVAFPEENPSVVRAGGAIPIAVLLAALPLDVVLRRFDGQLPGPSGLLGASVSVGLVFLASAGVTHRWYFGEYDRQYRRWTWNTTDMGRVVRGFADSVGDLAHAYHIPYDHWADTRNIGINAGDITWRNEVDVLEALRDHASDPAAKLYLLHISDRESLNALQQHFPLSQVKRHRSDVPRWDFLIVVVPAREGALRWSTPSRDPGGRPPPIAVLQVEADSSREPSSLFRR